MKAFTQLFLANLREFVRDRMALFWTLAFPVLFIVIFGLIFGRNNPFSADISLVVEEQSQVAQQIGNTFKQVEVFKLQEGSRQEQLAQLLDGELDAVIIIPAGTSAAFEASQPAPIELHYDPSRNTSTTIVSIVDRVLQGTAQQLRPTPQIFALRPVTVQATQLSSLDFLVPGILAMSIMNLGLFATAMPLISLRSQGILRRLGATPLPRPILLAAYIAMRLLMALLQTAIIVLVGIVAFGAKMVGSWLVFSGILLLGTLAFIGIGFFIAAIARTEESGTALTSAIQFPMMFLSGIFFPLEFMPEFLKPVINALPLTYLADALRQEMIESTPFHAMSLNLAVLAIWLLATTALSIRFFRWE